MKAEAALLRDAFRRRAERLRKEPDERGEKGKKTWTIQVDQERPHSARYPPCTTKLMADPPPSRSALPVGGAGISVQTAAVSSMRSSGENL